MAAPVAPEATVHPDEVPRWGSGTTLAVGVVAAGAAAGAAVAGCHPTGAASTDAVLTALLAVALVALGSRARPLALAVTAGAALVATGPLPLRGLALVALALAGFLAVAVVAPLPPTVEEEPPEPLEDDPLPDDVAPPEDPTPPLAWRPVVSALVAALAVQVLLRLPDGGVARLSAVLALVAMVPTAVSGWRGLAAGGRRTARRLALVTGVLVVVGALSGLATGLVAASAIQSGVDGTQAGLEALRTGEQEGGIDELRAATEDLRQARTATRSLWALPGRHLPLVAPQVRALDAVADGGAETGTLATDGAERVDADELQLVDGRLDPAAVAAVGPVLEEVAAGASQVRREISSDDVRSVWQVPPVVDGLDRFGAELADAEGSAETGVLASEVGPELLGAGGQARYFVAFVTPSEARGTGFMGSFGLLTATDGRLDLSEVGRTKELNDGGKDVKEITGPPDYLERYAQFDPGTSWENVTFTPDGPTVAQVMAEIYPQSGGEEVDGVLRIDPAGIARLLRVTGPVEVEGLPYRLDATNVESFLLVEQYRLYTDRNARVDVLGDVAEAVFDALTQQSIAPPRLARALGPAVRGGDITVWLRSEAGTALVDRLGVTGAVPPVEGDGFGVVTQNAGGSKIDAFLQRSIRYLPEVDAATGAVRATAEIELVNDAPASGEPPYLIGNLVDLPEGTNRMYLSAYSPLDLVSAELDGAPIGLEAGRELGRNVWSTFLDVPPGGRVTLTLELAGALDLSDGQYRFDLLPQAMAQPDRITVLTSVTHGHIESLTTDAVDGKAEVADDGVGLVDVPAEQGTFRAVATLARDGP